MTTKNRMRWICVCGSRDFNDQALMNDTLDSLLHAIGQFHIVSGGARGADRCAENFARSRQLSITIIYAQWDKLGKSAGFRRNDEMLRLSDNVIAFWDGESRGTGYMIESAKKTGKPYTVIDFTDRDIGETSAPQYIGA
jgi:hypothetical protein